MVNLNTPLEKIGRISPKYAKTLQKLGVFTVRDFLLYLPFRYDDFRKLVPVSEEFIGQNITMEGHVTKTRLNRIWKRRLTVVEIFLEDSNGTKLKAVWFNQPFILESLQEGTAARLSGKLSQEGRTFIMNSPSWEKASRDATNTARLVPVYPETSGFTSKWIRWQMKDLLPLAKNISDPLPSEILKKYNLYDIQTALYQLHFPDSKEKMVRAQKRMAFQEMFLFQLQAIKIKKDWEKRKSFAIKFDEKLIKNFVANLPFKLTDAQKKSTFEILKDLEESRPMNRLLNGDVGSGKTVVAAIAAFETIKNGHQVAIMAPTEVLAKQHFESFCELFKKYNINISLLTSSYKLFCHRERNEVKRGDLEINNKIAAVASLPRNDMLNKIYRGEMNLVIGTHALIQKDVKFNNLALVVIDEQHRFGVMQRSALQNVAQTSTDLTQTYTENNKDDLLYKDLTYKIRGAVFKVKKELGLGHKENIYQKAIIEEFNNIGLFFEKEKNIDIKYNIKKIGVYRPDFIVENKVILEFKALPSIGKFEKQQVWHYLKGSNYKLALLINFGHDDIQIERFIYTGQHKSVSSPYKSELVPHLLTMTATPIPRTLAIAIFGSLDLSILDEMPKNRKPIITKVISPGEREKIYEFVRSEIKKGRQIFVILPLIEESASETMASVKAAKAEYERLSKDIFSEFNLGLLHGRLKPKDKEKVMEDFKNKEINILVSTSVVEVGIDIPNATVMIIENSERFGLSQLHQFRGRVGRGAHQSYCFLFSETGSKRINILAKTNDGFKIAEEDLKFRGPGQFFGTLQSGLPDITMENLSNVKLIKFARAEAKEILEKDSKLKKHPLLADALQKFSNRIHLE